MNGEYSLHTKSIYTGGKYMENPLYVLFIERTKIYNKINKAMVIKHVDYIRNLDDNGKVELCGAFKGYPGVAGMIVLKGVNREEADEICKSEPFVAEGYATYKLHTLQAGNRENNYLL
jgi:uncharacterized protein YciI